MNFFFKRKDENKSYKLFQYALRNFNIGKPFYDFLVQSNIEMVKEYAKSSLIKGVVVVGGDDTCQNCKPLLGKEYSLDDAIKLKPIPVKSCKNELSINGGWCRCMYNSVLKKD